jgi:hypothetical protein
MNSHDLESVILDAARGQLADTPELKEVLAHTSACRECAARLADQRTLTAGLERLATLTRNERAPARIEAALRVAYRERILTPAQVDLVRPPAKWTRWALATAAAAAILAVLALTAWRGRTPSDQPQTTAGAESSRPGNQSSPQPKPETPVPVSPDSGQPKPKRFLRHYRAEQRRQVAPADQSRRGTSDREIATDFMPMSGSDPIPIDSGSLVRVELPRSALESFGLPMNMERAGERIKADVLVGSDGLARAIRFVR